MRASSRWVIVFVVGVACRQTLVARADCRAESVSVDTSRGDSYTGGIVGHSPGETFIARDTLISSISVWLEPEDWNNGWPMKLWVVNVDSATGVPYPPSVI